MYNLALEENEFIREELARLRQLIIRVEPTVLLDGRFEEMFLSPIKIIDIACHLLRELPELRQLEQQVTKGMLFIPAAAHDQ